MQRLAGFTSPAKSIRSKKGSWAEPSPLSWTRFLREVTTACMKLTTQGQAILVYDGEVQYKSNLQGETTARTTQPKLPPTKLLSWLKKTHRCRDAQEAVLTYTAQL